MPSIRRQNATFPTTDWVIHLRRAAKMTALMYEVLFQLSRFMAVGKIEK
jgi:hypothetical protein